MYYDNNEAAVSTIVKVSFVASRLHRNTSICPFSKIMEETCIQLQNTIKNQIQYCLQYIVWVLL